MMMTTDNPLLMAPISLRFTDVMQYYTEAMTLGAFEMCKSAHLRIHLHLPFSLPNVFSMAILALLCQ